MQKKMVRKENNFQGTSTIHRTEGKAEIERELTLYFLFFIQQQSKVLIKRIERTKRKCVTSVFGLENFGNAKPTIIAQWLDWFHCAWMAGYLLLT